MAGEDQQSSAPRVFEGFSSPRYTQVPDTIFDQLLPDLKEAELKVLLYIVRRTFGFGKDSDNISLKQLCSGIVTKDGRQIDRGTGLSKSGVTRALLSLRRQGILIRTRNMDLEWGNAPTNYRLRMVGEPLDIEDEPPLLEDLPLSPLRDKGVPAEGQGVSPLGDKGGSPEGQGVVASQGQALSLLGDTQETVKQETDSQERPFEISKGQQPRISYSETRMILQPYIADFAREFRDQATQTSSLTRAVNLCDRSGLDVDDFIEVMFRARAQTQEYSASIRAKVANNDGWGGKTKMAYFFTVLEDMLGLRNQSQRSGD